MILYRKEIIFKALDVIQIDDRILLSVIYFLLIFTLVHLKRLNCYIIRQEVRISIHYLISSSNIIFLSLSRSKVTLSRSKDLVH